MAKKIQLQDANGNVLHPLTLGECVTMDNGENLDTLMSKSQMFTPTITQDKSMFKVGTGIDVDYSANVKDGAYESLVFKGKSLVNLIEKPTSANMGNSKKWNGYGGGNPSKTFITNGIRLTNTQHGSIVLDYFDLSLFKPNTKYTLFIDVYHNGEGTAPVLDKIAGTGHYAIPLKNGHNCIVFTTVPDLTVANMGIRFGYAGSTSESCVYEFSNIVIVEGDHSSINPDYFTGLCDSKMPILRNVGKNLFDKNTMKTSWWANQDGVKKDYGNTNYSILVPATQNKVYSVSFDVSNRSFYAFLDKDYNTLLLQTGYVTKTAPQGTKYLLYYLHSENIDLCGDIQLEEATAKTVHEDYKTNILRTSEEIVLRSLPNGVCDTYNARTGEYVKRIGERTLNGSEAWIANSGTDKQFEDVWVFHNQESLCNGTVRLCDKLQARENANENAEFIRGGGAYIFVYISKNKVQNHNANDFKTWLQSNPITVQYELAEPVTTIVKPSTTTPFAYQNGHVIVESGFEGQSLLPEIEYSVVTGRTGQVTQNTKVLRQQEQQIIGLEELLLTQVVQMEYERTLLQFDYELQMMMLG